MDVVSWVLLAVAALGSLAAAAGVWLRRPGRRAEEALEARLEALRTALDGAIRDSAQRAAESQGRLGVEIVTRVDEVRARMLETLGSTVQQLGRSQSEAFEGLQERVARELHRMRQDNEQKLETIRAAVEERLQKTLETRLGESFRLVSERLEQVHKGLGEMQALASTVGDLKRVLTNVRTRGTFGEVQLGALIEQVLAPSQYETNVATVPGSRERVEFAIKMPGRDDQGVVYLPVDAKFPQEDFLRLQDAYDAGDPAAVEAARRALRSRLVAEAARIREKYLSPPHTTDVALMFVPTEGLYAEALRMEGLVERLQRESRVVLVGPTTLYAVLNSLQMGFRTLAIERRSSEVWELLGAVKTEFEKFGRSLADVKKKLQEASNKIEASERRTRVMRRRLKEVEALPEAEAGALLPELADEDDEP